MSEWRQPRRHCASNRYPADTTVLGSTSGVEPLDRYLRQQAGQDFRRRVASCFVLVADDDAVPIGYYTLAATSIMLASLPPAMARRLPRYPDVPAILMWAPGGRSTPSSAWIRGNCCFSMPFWPRATQRDRGLRLCRRCQRRQGRGVLCPLPFHADRPTGHEIVRPDGRSGVTPSVSRGKERGR